MDTNEVWIQLLPQRTKHKTFVLDKEGTYWEEAHHRVATSAPEGRNGLPFDSREDL